MNTKHVENFKKKHNIGKLEFYEALLSDGNGKVSVMWDSEKYYVICHSRDRSRLLLEISTLKKLILSLHLDLMG